MGALGGADSQHRRCPAHPAGLPSTQRQGLYTFTPRLNNPILQKCSHNLVQKKRGEAFKPLSLLPQSGGLVQHDLSTAGGVYGFFENFSAGERNVMNKDIALPIALFFFSALLTVVLHPAALLLAGAVVCVIAVLKYRSQKVEELKLGTTLLFRSGLAVLAGAIVAVALVLAAMSGLFAR